MPNKYKDDIHEAYLDDEKKYYDYGTATYSGDGNVVDLNHTGMSFYDQFLNTSELEYLRSKKNLEGEIVMMTPEEYYNECATKIFKCSVEKLKRERGVYDRKIIDKLHNVVKVFKKKLCLPMINYADIGQEGLHRMLAIAEMFGWDHKVPVLVVDWYDKDRHEREEKEANQHKIDNLVERAITETLHYNFTDLEDFSIQLQSEMLRQFKYEDEISVPEELEINETDSSYILVFMNHEYPIDKDEIKWRNEDNNIESELDDIDLESDEDFLVRYFGKDWKTTHPHLKDTFNIKENVESSEVDKEVIVSVLDEHNHCYYQNSSMALEIICEDLFYNYKIDARYRGRTIYIGDKKIATIKVDRESWNRLGMYGYTLYI